MDVRSLFGLKIGFISPLVMMGPNGVIRFREILTEFQLNTWEEGNFYTMIINSKFRDYYDTALAHGVDKTVVFNRHSRFEDFKKEDWKLQLPLRISWTAFNGPKESFFIGFCGKWYKGVGHVGWGRGKNFEDVIFTATDGIKDLTLFRKFNAPIIALYTKGLDHEFLINPQLNNFLFYKKVDPFTACQEIQMFLQNELAEEKEVGDIPDKYKILSHGMDETSFRRDKGGPTRKRKKLK